MKISIVNGPNLNLIGSRETAIYGDISLNTYFENLKKLYNTIEFDFFQSNVEGELIDYLQQCTANGIILNAGGYTHTSVAIRDCVAAISTPVVEVHISNLKKREDFRHESLISDVVEGCIFGFGLEGYRLALNYFQHR